MGSDPITLYLTKISRNKLYIRDAGTYKAKSTTRLGKCCWQIHCLTKAIFQALIMFGMVPVQVLQLPSIQQIPASLMPSSLQDVQVCHHNRSNLHPRLACSWECLRDCQRGNCLPHLRTLLLCMPLLHFRIYLGNPNCKFCRKHKNQIPLQLGQSGGTSGLTAQIPSLTGLPIL
jgi:hypothetical protein